MAHGVAAGEVGLPGNGSPMTSGHGITFDQLDAVFRMKHGEPDKVGWCMATWYRAGYFQPDDHYEALVDTLVKPGQAWLDVGCGRDLFPQNPRLAAVLAARSGHVVGVDPDANVYDNPYVHEKVQAGIDDFTSPRTYPLITLRMVAEHLADPDRSLRSLAALASQGGKVVVYTVNAWSPAAVGAWVVPFRLHHPVKRLLWGCEERDTFPVSYKLNTRGALTDAFTGAGFREVFYRELADLRVLARFRTLQPLELFAWRAFTRLGVRYPESCLLAVYQRT